jgi:hypothetical protein
VGAWGKAANALNVIERRLGPLAHRRVADGKDEVGTGDDVGEARERRQTGPRGSIRLLLPLGHPALRSPSTIRAYWALKVGSSVQ